MRPLAIYIHWPFCKAKCPYCDFNSHVRAEVEEARWQTALLRELETLAPRAALHEVVSIFFGGGTPSLMPPATVSALIERIHVLFPVASNLEITLEANPTSVEAAKFEGFRTAGVNRLSMGIQSLREEELRFLGREHSVKEALAAYDLATRHFPRTSFDLIYARPEQTVQDWETELCEALTVAGTHLSLYQLTIEPNTAFYHAYHANRAFDLPEDSIAADMYALTQEMMEASGRPAYEISNHAAPGFECRHNLAYWRGEAYLGIGPGAHGRLDEAHGRTATATIKSPERWLEQVERVGQGLEIDEAMSAEQLREERVMMELRLNEGLDVSGAWAESIRQSPLLPRYEAMGLWHYVNQQLTLTRSGQLVMNRLALELLS